MLADRLRRRKFSRAQARSGGTPGPANVAKSTRRGSEEGVNQKKITLGHV